MYWLLAEEKQDKLREDMDVLVERLSKIVGSSQVDQLFPYVGRKDRRKARVVVDVLSPENGVVIEPFAGSGSLVYATLESGRTCCANEWEPYTHRMASAPFRLPSADSIDQAFAHLLAIVTDELNDLYKIVCSCGKTHVLDSQFFDREPLKYRDVENHKRLGPNGETITYRQQHRCSMCGATCKLFDEADERHMAEIQATPIPEAYQDLFTSKLIENSRINLSADFLIYKSLFPKRSILALCILWEGIISIDCDDIAREFLKDAFLSILPQAKFKDYRSKSQDLHVPAKKLREVNLLYRFEAQVNRRKKALLSYSFAGEETGLEINCLDFRDHLRGISEGAADLVFTDPPWTDGNAYFEKAQLYHPWIGYSLSQDVDRLEREIVVTDAPTRRDIHNVERWWYDAEQFFQESERVLKVGAYLALFFRPIPAAQWLSNLNKLKLISRRSGFEPLLSIDVGGYDPSMRIQQSASYVFSKDIVFVFVKIPPETRRHYFGHHDIDQYVFQVAEQLQEKVRGPFTYRQWRDALSDFLIKQGLEELDLPHWEYRIHELFLRYCDEPTDGLFLPKAVTPFSGQLFDIPAIERLFTYTPVVVRQLLARGDTFSYDAFLLKLSEYVENGTRMLIDQIEQIDIRAIIEPYAIPLNEGRFFQRRPLPRLPYGLRNVLELDPYDFEAFIGKFLEVQGYTSVALIGRSGDRGVDLVATDPNGGSCVVQCKRYLRHNVSATPVQRLHSFATTRGAARMVLITTSDFTPQCVDEAAITGVELVNGDRLETMIGEYMPHYFDKD